MNRSDIKKRILVRRMQLWVHSYIYYQLDTNIVSDYTWMQWAQELVKLQNEYPNCSKSVVLYDIFKNFDGSTGTDLPFDIPWVKTKAQEVLKGTVKETFLLEGAGQ